MEIRDSLPLYFECGTFRSAGAWFTWDALSVSHDNLSSRSLKWFSHLVTRGRFFGLTSKIPPLGSMFNFDADVKKTTMRHQCENRLSFSRSLKDATRDVSTVNQT